jgi:nitric oxide reductase NorQ protein
MELAVEKYKVASEPYYLPIKNEVELFEAAFAAKLPAMLKGADRLRQDPFCRVHGTPS